MNPPNLSGVDNAYIADELMKMAKFHQKDVRRYNAYKNAAMAVRQHPFLITSGDYAKKNLKGVGSSSAEKIDEILKQGHPTVLNQLSLENKEMMQVTDLFQTIHGVGKVKAEEWYNLGYRTLQDLQPLFYNGSMTSAQKIGYMYYLDFQEKIPRSELDAANRIFQSVFSTADGSKDPTMKFEFAGSYRRGLQFSGDLDILFCSTRSDGSPVGFGDIINVLVNSGFIIAHLTETPTTKYMGVFRLSPNHKARRIDIRLIKPEFWASSLLYFTGSKQFNILMRNHALELGYHLSEYCLQKKVDRPEIPEAPIFSSEMEIFSFLGLKYKPPEERLENLLSLEKISSTFGHELIKTSEIEVAYPELMNLKILLNFKHKINWNSERLGLFDLDGTLVRNCHGKIFCLEPEEIEVFPGREAWLKNLILLNFSIVIVSNQKSSSPSKTDKIEKKLRKSLELLGIPCVLIAALNSDEYRKPGIGSWKIIEQWFPNAKISKSFFCGDAAGRPGDFSDSDFCFAKALGLKFGSPEEIFSLPPSDFFVE